MAKKETVLNNCQFCEHSAKTYFCIKNKVMSVDAAFCMKADMTENERKKRISNKVKCEHFKLGKIGKREQLNDMKEIMAEIARELELVKIKLEELSKANEADE